MKSRDHGAREGEGQHGQRKESKNETENEKETAEGDQAGNRRHHGHRNENNLRLQASKTNKPRESTRYLNESVSAGVRTTNQRSGKTSRPYNRDQRSERLGS